MTDLITEALSLILSLIIIVAVIFTATRCSKSLEPKEKPYNSETYKDDEVIYKIITDRAGDVIYCEPME